MFNLDNSWRLTFLRGTQADGERQTKAHDHNENDICRRANGTGGLPIGIQPQINCTANDGASSLSGLPYGQIEPSIFGTRIANNNSCLTYWRMIDSHQRFSKISERYHLRGPEETRRYAAHGTSPKHERSMWGMVIDVKSSSVQRVSNGSKWEIEWALLEYLWLNPCSYVPESESPLEAYAIVDSTRSYTNNGK